MVGNPEGRSFHDIAHMLKMFSNYLIFNYRQQYEDEINSVAVQVHFGDSYIYREGALKPLSSGHQLAYREITIDRRKSTEDLYNVICGVRDFNSKVPKYLDTNNFAAHSKTQTTLLTPSFGNRLFACHLVLKHPHTNMILSSFCIPKVVKSATIILKIDS